MINEPKLQFKHEGAVKHNKTVIVDGQKIQK
jgi:hypothetical protein